MAMTVRLWKGWRRGSDVGGTAAADGVCAMVAATVPPATATPTLTSRTTATAAMATATDLYQIVAYGSETLNHIFHTFLEK